MPGRLIQSLIGIVLLHSFSGAQPLTSLSVFGLRPGMRRVQVNKIMGGSGREESYTARHGNMVPITLTQSVYPRPGGGWVRVRFFPGRPGPKATDTAGEIQSDFAQVGKLVLQVGERLPRELQPPQGRPTTRYFTQGVLTYGGSTQWVFPVSGGYARLSMQSEKLSSITLSTGAFENQEVADWEDRNK
ncbi:MAG: hypothetical protein U0931_13210 [Vulcanimicrobiota bacterium]